MTEFWETAFHNKQEMWGMNSTKAAVLAKNFIIEKSLKNVLIPGIGYGRNAQPFIENGIKVSGIEISKTAIELAKKQYGREITLFHGSVTQMPFEDRKYDAIFCHALIHLLDSKQRIKLLQDCYNQLNENGYMFFTAITKDAPNYKKGKQIEKDRYEFHEGVKIYYYNQEAVKLEFKHFGLFEINEVQENQPMYFIKCKK
ncbi:SAM-dependent methyltransferase [Polaribacter reichenbachii]|uniref:Methyltransferase n=1 Tax=Polaribacter reichenbachii TaxID=996801 RepID=A0A1B8U464_9FLAO|nr:class I SAM-dependent methyltransferase [Polaribacter reichenbachii]APZ47405.1 SAM-dependent methyltransferase [Polaribacter reichenbachii]AUC18044.1 SAM-dependent methyltransferase [Polaribacter reichenbachii]OBY66654.1 methyltransferase [Polaribacter reichenbachii]